MMLLAETIARHERSPAHGNQCVRIFTDLAVKGRIAMRFMRPLNGVTVRSEILELGRDTKSTL